MIGLTLLVAAALGLGVGYAMVVPFGEKPDEPSHMARIVYEARFGRTPPVASAPVFPNVVTYEAVQPPFYYWLATWVVRRLPDIEWSISPARFVGCVERSRRFTLDAPSDPPLHATLLRLLGLACAMGSGVLVFLTARMLGGTQSQVILATGLSLLTPQVLFIASSVTNDTLALVMGSLVLALAVHAGAAGGVWACAAGALAVLGFGVKLNLAPYLAGAPLLMVAARPRRPGRALGMFVVGVAAVAAPGVLLHRWHAWVDQRGFIGRIAVLPDTLSKDYLSAIPDLFSSYWARFGWMDIEPATAVKIVWLVILVLATLGWMARSHAAGRQWLSLWPMLIAAVLGWMLTLSSSHQVQGRFLFPFAGVISLLVARGIGVLPLPGLGVVIPIALVGSNVVSLCQLHGDYRPAEWPDELLMDAHQCSADRIVLETLSHGAEVGQTFHCTHPGLRAVDLVFEGRTVAASDIVMTLRDEASSRVLRDVTVPSKLVVPRRYHRFYFAPVMKSGNRLLRFTVRLAEQDPEGTLSLWFALGDTYLDGALHVAGVPREGDLRFVTWADKAQEVTP